MGDPDDVAKGNDLLEQLAALGELDEVHARAQQLDLTDPDLVGGSAVAAGEKFLGDAWVAAAFYQVEGMRGAEAAIGRLSEIGRSVMLARPRSAGGTSYAGSWPRQRQRSRRYSRRAPDLAGHLGGLTLEVADLYTGHRAQATYELALRFGERAELAWLIEQARASLAR